MQSRGASGLVAPAQLVCAFCGHSEPLPSEPFARNHYLKERLRQMQRGREAAEVPLRKMLSLKKSMPLLALLITRVVRKRSVSIQEAVCEAILLGGLIASMFESWKSAGKATATSAFVVGSTFL